MRAEAVQVPRKQLGVLLWLAGMVGGVSLLPVLPSIVSTLSDVELPISVGLLRAVALAQTGVLLAVAVLIGVFLASRVGLRAPVAEAIVSRRSIMAALRPQLGPGIVGGLVGGLAVSIVALLLLPYVPEEFVAAARRLSLPLSVRFLYGGITEELLVRWGLMTLLVWLPYRIVQKGQGEVQVGYVVLAIAVSAIAFGAGHLPVASLLSPVLTAPLILYVIIANAMFGIVAGVLYWQRGLEAAMIAHMVAHVVMLSAERIVY